MFIHRTLLNTLLAAMLAVGISAARADSAPVGHPDQGVVAGDRDGGSDDRLLECITCSAGFMGSEDLGNGLKAIFKLDFGQVHVGTISTVYKSHGAGPDPFSHTPQQGRDRGLQPSLHRGADSAGQGRVEKTARYDSPGWKGLKLGATYTLVPDNKDNESGYGAGISYENGGILVFADYITNVTRDEDSVWKVGGKYTLNNFSLMAHYERDDGLISSKAANTFGDGAADIWRLGGSFTLGNSMLYFGYGNGSGGTDGGEDDKFSLGLEHKF